MRAREYRKVISSRFPMGVPTKYRPGLRGPCNAEPPQIKYKHSQKTPTNQQRKLKKGMWSYLFWQRLWDCVGVLCGDFRGGTKGNQANFIRENGEWLRRRPSTGQVRQSGQPPPWERSRRRRKSSSYHFFSGLGWNFFGYFTPDSLFLNNTPDSLEACILLATAFCSNNSFFFRFVQHLLNLRTPFHIKIQGSVKPQISYHRDNIADISFFPAPKAIHNLFAQKPSMANKKNQIWSLQIWLQHCSSNWYIFATLWVFSFSFTDRSW